MSKKRSAAFASIVAVLVLTSWIEDSKSQKTTPKAMKPDSPVTAKKTMRDFSLTGRQHFGNPFSRKGQFDQDMEELRETAGDCAEIDGICANKMKESDVIGSETGKWGLPWKIVAPCCRSKILGIIPSPFKPRCRLASSGDKLVCVDRGHELYDNPPQGSYEMPRN